MTVETTPILTLPQVAQMAEGDLHVAAVPREPSAREAFLRSGISGEASFGAGRNRDEKLSARISSGWIR